MTRARCLPGVSTALLLVGCSSPQDYMHAGGPAAAGLAHLGWTSLLAAGAATVIMWLLLGWISLRPRGTLAEHAPVDANSGQKWILYGGFLWPLVVLVGLYSVMLVTLRAYPMETAPHGFICRADPTTCPPAAIRIVGHQWWFDVQYLFDREDLNVQNATEIHVPVGKPVVLELVTRDVIHSFWIPKLHGKVDLVPGQTNEIEIQAGAPGVYDGECAEFCGQQHAHMRLLVVAQKDEEFGAWLAAQRAPAKDPANEAARHGRDVFMSAACVLCHRIAGTQAQGQVGPDLTHVGSRQTIAGGMLRNTTANLAAWITHAQSLKPGAQMPDITAFDGEELRALVSYLQSLQ